MSKRDGKMYMVGALHKSVRDSTGQDINCETDGLAGVLFVYWTKTAARKIWGRNVTLTQMEKPSNG